MAQETYDRAMDKLRDEMAASKGAVHMAGEIITLFLMADPENAEKVLAEGKTIAGAYGKMRDLAKQKRQECFDADQAADIFAEYYGFEKRSITDLWEAAQERRNEKPQAAADVPAAKTEPDDFDLDALLGW